MLSAEEVSIILLSLKVAAAYYSLATGKVTVL